MGGPQEQKPLGGAQKQKNLTRRRKNVFLLKQQEAKEARIERTKVLLVFVDVFMTEQDVKKKK